MNTITKFILLSILTFLFLTTGVMIGKEVQAETTNIFSILIYYVAGVIILLGIITLFLEKRTNSLSEKTNEKTKSFIKNLLIFTTISSIYALATIILLYTTIFYIECHRPLNIHNIFIVGFALIVSIFIKSKWSKFYFILMLATVVTTFFFPKFRYSIENLLPQQTASCRDICGNYVGEVNDHKPIIYLYPTKTTEVSVKLGNPQNLTHTYPKYETGWTVTAEPNGNLTDPKTNKHYYALYWEGKNTIEPNFKEGFVVNGKDTTPFLEEKLAQLGLNEREANEFIIYWLPKLESNPYNFIRFQTLEEQNQNMPLEVTPQPDTMIRVMMEFKNLVTPIIVKEQVLPPTPKRTGFTLVEWGGTDVTDNILIIFHLIVLKYIYNDHVIF